MAYLGHGVQGLFLDYESLYHTLEMKVLGSKEESYDLGSVYEYDVGQSPKP